MAASTIRQDRREEVVLFVDPVPDIEHNRFQKKKRITNLTPLTKLNLEILDMETALLLVRVDLINKDSLRQVFMVGMASREKNLQVWLVLMQTKQHNRDITHPSLIHCSPALRKTHKLLRQCQAPNRWVVQFRVP